MKVILGYVKFCNHNNTVVFCASDKRNKRTHSLPFFSPNYDTDVISVTKN